MVLSAPAVKARSRHVLPVASNISMAGCALASRSPAIRCRVLRKAVITVSPARLIIARAEMLQAAWAHAAPGREAAAQNEALRTFQPCPLSGKPDIEPKSPNDRD